MKRYSPISTKVTPTDKIIYNTVRYPEIPRSLSDIYVYTSVGDRFDTLAQQYYGDSSLWWVLSIANGNLNPGTTTSTSGRGSSGGGGGSVGSSGGGGGGY